MANYNATVDIRAKGGEIGQQYWSSGYYDLAGAITGHASTGDTITFAGRDMVPSGGAKLIDAKLVSVELDTNATPTGTCKVGTSADDDGIIDTTGVAVGLSNSLAEPLVRHANGALIGTNFVDATDIIIEFDAALATSATSGRVRLFCLWEGN